MPVNCDPFLAVRLSASLLISRPSSPPSQEMQQALTRTLATQLTGLLHLRLPASVAVLSLCCAVCADQGPAQSALSVWAAFIHNLYPAHHCL